MSPEPTPTDSGSTPDTELTRLIKEHIEQWQDLWGTAGLVAHMQVRFSARLRSTWGRTHPARGIVTLAKALEVGPRALLEEVLCHEAAHVAAYMRYGSRARLHGPEWAALVRAAGFTPARALHALEFSTPKARARARYEHRCPVCQFRRLARRPVHAWRCAACTRAGLPGALTITRLTSET